MTLLPFEGAGTGWRATSQPVIIKAGQSLSPPIDLGSRRLFAIQMPSAWTPADLTFQATLDEENWFDLFDEYGAEREVGAGASRIIQIDPGPWLGLSRLKIRSGTAGVPVVQVAERVIYILGVP